MLRTILNYHAAKNNLRKQEDRSSGNITLVPLVPPGKLIKHFERRADIADFVLGALFDGSADVPAAERGMKEVSFSVVGLFQAYQTAQRLPLFKEGLTLSDMEDALLYLSRIGALRLEGGFLVLYNGMELHRTVTDNRVRYKSEDYRLLDEFYKQKIRQIHIVGEYANLMVRDYSAALQFVQDYFQSDFRDFVRKYFQGRRARELEQNITEAKYRELFGSLSDRQSEIIRDSSSRVIAVAAGPGSGKTLVLVHKLASLLLMEDVKHEQLLMLTFSRAAATEFRSRLRDLIGNAANFVEIRTFHSFCFSLLGKIGRLDTSDEVVEEAAGLIQRGEAEPGRIARTVLVIDEAQDMDAKEYALVSALMHANPGMRVIAVGDDDQNIYSFRGSDSRYLRQLSQLRGAGIYTMVQNYRSAPEIIAFSNAFAAGIGNRMKTEPVEAVRREHGTVSITLYSSAHFERALVRQLIESRESGQRCVLTATNEEALCILGLLQEQGLRAGLIQSLDGFRLTELVEIRFFLRVIDRSLHSPVIPDSLWAKAKDRLYSAYADSACLENCRNLIERFETLYPAHYRTDLEEFIGESRFEDFFTDRQDRITVSTIHKAKGREFDSVWMLLQGVTANTDDEKRVLYVGMTRARNRLFIHSNRPIMPAIHREGICQLRDRETYEEPSELTLHLTHRDVNLGYFLPRKQVILSLRSGMPLSPDGDGLCTEKNGRPVRVLRYSKAFSERLALLAEKGFLPASASIRFIVAWKGEEDGQESAVILPSLRLKRSPPEESS